MKARAELRSIRHQLPCLLLALRRYTLTCLEVNLVLARKIEATWIYHLGLQLNFINDLNYILDLSLMPLNIINNLNIERCLLRKLRRLRSRLKKRRVSLASLV